MTLHVALPLCPGSIPVVGTVCNAVSGVAGKAAGIGATAVFDAAGAWVSSGAVWLIGQVGHVMSATTSDDLGTGWFGAHEAVMAGLAAAVVVPMACCAAIQAIYRQSPSMLMRTFLVHLPLSLLLTGVAVTLVRISLAVTDALSARVMSSAGVDTSNLFSGMSAFFTTVGSTPAVPAFVVFVSALLVSLAALVLWLELVVRAAAVSAAVLFLPLALAALVWPAVAHWCRRLADTIAALVLSKLVIAAVISLAVGALAGGLGLSGSSSGGGFGAVMVGIALLLVATLSPFTLLRLVPAVEAGAVAHLESTRHRLQSAARAVGGRGNLALDEVRKLGGPGTAALEAAVGTAGAVGTVSAGATGSVAATGSGGSGGSAGAGGPGGSDGPAGSGPSGSIAMRTGRASPGFEPGDGARSAGQSGGSGSRAVAGADAGVHAGRRGVSDGTTAPLATDRSVTDRVPANGDVDRAGG